LLATSIYMLVQERAAFLFVAQQGTLSPGLSSHLREEPAFTAAFAECERQIQDRSGWSLTEEIFKPHDVHTSRDQPVVTALQIAWVSLLRSVGVNASAAGGLSGGEAAAAWCCEAISVADTIDLTLQLGRLAEQDASIGAIGYLRTDWGTAGELIERYAREVARAVEMSGDLTVIAGPSESVDRVMQAAAAHGIGSKRLPFDRAYHNALIDELEGSFCDGLRALRSHDTRIPMYSAVTRRIHDGGALKAPHWWQVARAPNYFYSMVQQMIADGYRRFVEIGPTPMLAETVRQAARSTGDRVEVLTVADCLRGRS
jgi:acyl transferase domain-containing protein